MKPIKVDDLSEFDAAPYVGVEGCRAVFEKQTFETKIADLPPRLCGELFCLMRYTKLV